MMTKAQKTELGKIAQIRYEEPMKEHISFRVGGPAEAFVEPDEAQLKELIRFARAEGIPITILGNGTNVLVRDEGLRGLVILIGRPMSEIRIEGEEIYAQAGALLSTVSKAACEAGLSGLAFAGGIPGSIGGAVVMNAGAYGGEMADVLSSVEVLDASGQTHTYDVSELDLSYRHSRFIQEGTADPSEIVLSVRFRLSAGDREEIRAKMADLAARRREKQPLSFPSAGSTFKRPEGHFAGKLIEEAGLKGYSVGGAQVSALHCGFVVNTGGAVASDVLAVIAHVKAEVEKNSGVLLQEEVRIL